MSVPKPRYYRFIFTKQFFLQTQFILFYITYEYITFTVFTTFRRINKIMMGNEVEDLVPRKHISNRECRPKILQSKLLVYSSILINQYYTASKLNSEFPYSYRTIGSWSHYIFDNFSVHLEVPIVNFFKLTEVFIFLIFNHIISNWIFMKPIICFCGSMTSAYLIFTKL
jgi:hypothetical protein